MSSFANTFLFLVLGPSPKVWKSLDGIFSSTFHRWEAKLLSQVLGTNCHGSGDPGSASELARWAANGRPGSKVATARWRWEEKIIKDNESLFPLVI